MPVVHEYRQVYGCCDGGAGEIDVQILAEVWTDVIAVEDALDG
ncbi:hypothetical protein [Rhodococcus sp. OK302]|nr:hypothetical protein [Rhodococcus sp. OK302]